MFNERAVALFIILRSKASQRRR